MAILLHGGWATEFSRSHQLTPTSHLHLHSVYLSWCFEIIWLLPRRLLRFSIIVIRSSIRWFVLCPCGFLGKEKILMMSNCQLRCCRKPQSSWTQVESRSTCLEWSSVAELLVVAVCWAAQTTGCVVWGWNKTELWKDILVNISFSFQRVY